LCEKFYDPLAKPHSKASGFNGGRCGDCHRENTRTATVAYRTTPDGRAKSNAASRAYSKANRGKCAALDAAYKATKLQRTRSWTQHDQITKLYEEAARLTKETGIPHHVDHGIPLRGETDSGLHVLENLRILPGPENIRKSNSRDLEWERSLGYHVD